MAFDLEAIRKKMNQLNGKRGSNVQMWKPEGAGEFRIRCMPWAADKTADGTPFIERLFYYIGDNRGILAPKQFGEEDPVADLISSLYDSGSEGDREIAKKLLPKMRAYLPILVQGEEDKGVQVYSFNRNVYQRLLSFFVHEDIGDITDIHEGFDLIVTIVDSGRKWQGRAMFDQNIDAARKPTHLKKWFDGDEDKMEEALSKLPNIDDMYVNARKTPAECQEILNAFAGAGEEEKDDVGTSRGSSSDKLDELAEDVKAGSSDGDASEEKPKARKRRVKKTEVDLDESSDTSEETEKNLDAAFDGLMEDDD